MRDGSCIETGRVAAVHGINGEIKIQPWADQPEVFLDFPRVRLGEDEYDTERVRVHKGMVIAKLRGVDGVEQAQGLLGRTVWVRREALPLPEGAYFVQDLIGMRVLDADSGEVYGVLTDVLATGANDVYTVRTPEGRELLIPAIPQVIISVDIPARIMRIAPMEGLFDL